MARNGMAAMASSIVANGKIIHGEGAAESGMAASIASGVHKRRQGGTQRKEGCGAQQIRGKPQYLFLTAPVAKPDGAAQTNYVRKIYEPFTPDQISAKIVEPRCGSGIHTGGDFCTGCCSHAFS